MGDVRLRPIKLVRDELKPTACLAVTLRGKRPWDRPPAIQHHGQ